MSADEHVAPVIPIFGGAAARRAADAEPAGDEPVHSPGPRHPAAAAAGHADGQRRSSEHNGGVSSLRPLGRHAGADAGSAPGRSGTRGPAGADGGDVGVDGAEDSEEIRRRAEEVLVRKLRARALSASEAREVLRGQDVSRDLVDEIVDDFIARGYIDDRTLASLLVTSGVERKGQGRTALARSLAQRGIPRDIVDDVLGELPDDDAERALDYARGKARAMARLDPETALRRLTGQLARRGYRGSVAMNAARTALREAGGGPSGVRFVESD